MAPHQPPPSPVPSSPITGYHLDEDHHWVAELACDHFQHVRHDPPLMRRNWVTTAAGRRSMLGYPLRCKKCLEGAPPDKLDLDSLPATIRTEAE